MRKIYHNVSGQRRLRLIAANSVIAALYAAMTLSLSFLSFGPVQFRFAEALCLVPLFIPALIPGLTAGCLVANFAGFMIGANPLGLVDSVFGTAATLLAVIFVAVIGKKAKSKPVLILISPLPVIFFNAVIVGAELSLFTTEQFSWGAFFFLAASVAAGEAAVLYTAGIGLSFFLQKSPRLIEKMRPGRA